MRLKEQSGSGENTHTTQVGSICICECSHRGNVCEPTVPAGNVGIADWREGLLTSLSPRLFSSDFIQTSN